MFTGLIEEVGTIRELHRRGDRYDLTIGANTITGDLAVDDSVNVSGVCLTVVDYTESAFRVQVVPQTIRMTAFRQYQVGDRVNLERAMTAGGRFGGHFVQGHADGTASVTRLTRHADHAELAVRCERELIRFCVPQGSIAIDGVSLTIASLREDQVEVALIPHTLHETNLQDRTMGDVVNIEVDMLSKYVERHVARQTVSPITLEWLTEQGF